LAFEIRLTPQARFDLVEVHDWTWFRFGQKQADNYVAEIAASFRLVAENPALARDAGNVREGLKKIVSGSHIVFMRQSSKTVTIVRILHGAMDHRKHLK
jgi:toxin ParE1/3/4